ncbi:hypothetical protein EIP86_000345 [Pleurotus ostreatoroseus]|nr:hypothetical protein EIP86_000345 [Pleurotus ostreatoroseus]
MAEDELWTSMVAASGAVPALRKVGRRWGRSLRRPLRRLFPWPFRAGDPAPNTSQAASWLPSALTSPSYAEELDALTSDACDVTILDAVDSNLSDDELLGTVMRRALWHAQLRGSMADILSFVVSATQRRAHAPSWIIGSSVDDDRRFIDGLTPRSRSALIDILCDALCYNLRPMFHPTDGFAHHNGIRSDWMLQAFRMILSLSDSVLKPSEGAAMVSYLMYNQESFKNEVAVYHPILSYEECLLLLGIAKEKLTSSDGHSTLAAVRAILLWLEGCRLSEDVTLSDILEAIHPPLQSTCLLSISAILLKVMQPLLDKKNTEMVKNPEPWTEEILLYFVDACDASRHHYNIQPVEEIGRYIARMLAHSRWSAALVLKTLIRGHLLDWHTRYWMLGILIREQIGHEDVKLLAMVHNIRRAVVAVADRLDVMGLCLVLCNIASHFSSEDVHTTRLYWHEIFNKVAKLPIFKTDATSDDRSYATHCLESMTVFDQFGPCSHSGLATSTHIVPDALVSILVQLSGESQRIDHLPRVQAYRGIGHTPGASRTSRVADPGVVYDPTMEFPTVDSAMFSREDSGEQFGPSYMSNLHSSHAPPNASAQEAPAPSAYPWEASVVAPQIPSALQLSSTRTSSPLTSSLLSRLPPLPALRSLPSFERGFVTPLEGQLPTTEPVDLIVPEIIRDIPGEHPSPPGFRPRALRRTHNSQVSTNTSVNVGKDPKQFINLDSLVDGETFGRSLYSLDLRRFTDDPIRPSSEEFTTPGEVPSTIYFRPATHPPVSQLTIIYWERFHWYESLSLPQTASMSSSMITVGILLDAVRVMMRKLVIPEEHRQLGESERFNAEEACRARCAGYESHIRDREMNAGLRRVDLLGRKCIFTGLLPSWASNGGVLAAGLRLAEISQRGLSPPFPLSVINLPRSENRDHDIRTMAEEASYQTSPLFPPLSPPHTT